MREMGDAVVADEGDGVVGELNGSKWRQINIGNFVEFIREVGATGALNLGGKGDGGGKVWRVAESWKVVSWRGWILIRQWRWTPRLWLR
jgi:hypothetical protein